MPTKKIYLTIGDLWFKPNKLTKQMYVAMQSWQEYILYIINLENSLNKQQQQQMLEKEASDF